MDLNNLLNDRPTPMPSKPPPPPPPPLQASHQTSHSQPPQHQQNSLPSTPVQGSTPQFQDYGHPPRASPSRGMSQEFGPHGIQPGQYPSPQAYQQQQPPYPGRPAPPPLQPLSSDVRSPSAASGLGLGPGPSPYRPTPTSSISSASGGYPFPPPQQPPASPGQRHQYPPTSAYPGREGYPQPGGSIGGSHGAQGQNTYAQGPPMPQTPPVGTPGQTHPYLQQRPSSTYSATPTSATTHQPSQYGAPFGSPLSTTHPPPQYPDYGRQRSQPPTPLGPPPRQPSAPHGFAQPPSPYQQRISTTGSGYPPSLVHHPQASPSAPAPPSIPRVPSNHSIYDNPRADSSGRGSQSQSERDRSLSVSPKTRIPSLPSSSGHAGYPQPDSDPRAYPNSSMHATAPASSVLEPGRSMEQRSDRAVTPGKRKLDDRDMSRDELEKRDVRPPPFDKQPNGSAPKAEAPAPAPQQPAAPPPGPPPTKKRKVRHTTPPIWARTYREGMPLKNANFVLRKPAHNVGQQPNGKTGSVSRHQPGRSRQTSPEERRGPPPVLRPPQVDELPNQGKSLGPWESCISGATPIDDVAKAVADFLFLNVVSNPDIHEITSRNVQFEIEAKVGTLIDRETNDRVALHVRTDCVLDEGLSVQFQSSMSEEQHKAFNEYFNSLVQDTHPKRPAMDADGRPRVPRVPIMYKHRRETDRFLELPPPLRAQLPACVQTRIPYHRQAKVRVTYDQTSGAVIAKIVKARVADLDLHMPASPFDCRISVNLEMEWDGSLEELERAAAGPLASPARKKDRLSYTQSHYQIDLTQVTQGGQGTQYPHKEHEIEIEVSAAAIIDQGRRAEAGQEHQYDLLVEGFVNNVRHLARKARQFAG